MQNTQQRCLVLIVVLTASWGLLMGSQRSDALATRWPTDEDVFQAPGWQATPPSVERAYFDVHVITRNYVAADGARASLVIKTDHEAKNIYRAGAELGFLGGGYAVEPAPADLVPSAPASSALIVSGEKGRWLVLYSYGERRGLLGNSPLAWALATLDGLLAEPADYYQLTLMTRLDGADDSSPRQVTALAETLFPRVAAWYGTAR